MIFLDTHAVVILIEESSRVPRTVHHYLENEPLFLSPMARLELEWLHEVGQICHEPATISDFLARTLAVSVENDGWARAAEIA